MSPTPLMRTRQNVDIRFMWGGFRETDERHAEKSVRGFTERLKALESQGQGEVSLEGVAAAGGVEDRDVTYVEIQTHPDFLHPHQDIQRDQY